MEVFLGFLGWGGEEGKGYLVWIFGKILLGYRACVFFFSRC